MSKQQRDAIDAALRAEPFNLSQSTAEHRKSFDAFAIRPYPGTSASPRRPGDRMNPWPSGKIREGLSRTAGMPASPRTAGMPAASCE